MRTSVYQLVELRDVTVHDLEYSELLECYYVDHQDISYELVEGDFIPHGKNSFSLLLIDNDDCEGWGKAVVRIIK